MSRWPLRNRRWTTRHPAAGATAPRSALPARRTPAWPLTWGQRYGERPDGAITDRRCARIDFDAAIAAHESDRRARRATDVDVSAAHQLRAAQRRHVDRAAHHDRIAASSPSSSPRAGSACTATTQQSNVPAGTRTRSSPITDEPRRDHRVSLPASTDERRRRVLPAGRAAAAARSAVSSIAAAEQRPARNAATIERRPAGSARRAEHRVAAELRGRAARCPSVAAPVHRA